MLRNRSRAVTSKQPLMADSQPSPTHKNYSKSPSFFDSPRFRGFAIKGSFETDSNLISPTSILDTTKPFPFGRNPFSGDQIQPKTPKTQPGNKPFWEKSEAKGIGLALVQTLKDENLEDKNSKTSNRKVLFGTKLRVQIPKTLNSQFSETGSVNSGIQTENPNSGSNSGGCVSERSEMELSEDYTCVISRGPKPRTTHIFDNCIVESYHTMSDQSSSGSENFLSFCYTCRKNLEQKIDIYIYRGEKAFCSQECRYQEMLLDEVGNTELDDTFRSCS
ncbi:protein MARD1-like [Pyrus communis]|uniref:protein MARD1-like n=1 Tax=Pyrus communis TaxID=23211 RepID=UPI0035C25A74